MRTENVEYTVLIYRVVIQFKSVQHCLFSVNVYRDVMILIICLCRLIYSIICMCSKYPPSAHADALIHARQCQWMC